MIDRCSVTLCLEQWCIELIADIITCSNVSSKCHGNPVVAEVFQSGQKRRIDQQADRMTLQVGCKKSENNKIKIEDKGENLQYSIHKSFN